MRTKEIWKPVVNWINYSVSNLGKIKRITPYNTTKIGKILKPIINHKGYAQVNLCQAGGKRKTIFVHRIVGEAFFGEKKEKYGINHKDTNKLNNQADNLEWSTQKENTVHAILNGKHNRFQFIKTWSINFLECRSCKTKTRKHVAHGLCIDCYSRNRPNKHSNHDMSNKP